MLYSINRIRLVTVVIAVAFLIPLCITKTLWLSEHFRFFALVPIHPTLPKINYPLDCLFFCSMLFLLVLIVFLKKRLVLIPVFVAVTVFYSLFDQNRWQPYYYQFLAMFLVIYFYSSQSKSEEEVERKTLTTLSVILISIWFWSGLHKLHLRYFLEGLPYFASSVDQSLQRFVFMLGFMSPLVEFGAALLLLFQRTRRYAVFLLILMHSIILFVLGPLGLDANPSVWSWNIAQAVFCYLVFWNNSELTLKGIFLLRAFLHRVVILMFLIMPVFNFFGLWDAYLSHSLYSWSVVQANIIIESEELKEKLPDEVRGVLYEKDRVIGLGLTRWSYSVLESPVYPSERVFRAVFAKLCEHLSYTEKMKLLIYHRPDFRTAERDVDVYLCTDETEKTKLLSSFVYQPQLEN